jgi:glycosyltransferase involved in cell wall biosynthesis
MSRRQKSDTRVANSAGLDVQQTVKAISATAGVGKRVAGDPRAMYKEARSLAGWGYQVTYVCNAGSGPMVTDDNVAIDALKMPASRFVRQMCGPGMVLREAMRFRPDVVHVFDLALIGPALRLQRRYGVKVVVDLPEDNAKQILQKSYLGPMAVRRLVSRLYQRLSQRSLPRANLVIAATASIDAALPEGCQHTVGRNFPAIADIDAVSPLGLVSSPIGAQAFRVVYVGGMSPVRGIRELILATGMLRGAVELHLAGPMYSSRFFGELQSMPAWRHCHYHGWLDWQESIALIKACDVGACVLQAAPNHVEALPVKVFEYMACGRGSIVSPFPLWRHLFAGAALFVDQMKPASIARLMEQLLTQPTLLSRLSGRGRSLAETLYSWESESQQLAEGYRRLWQ